MSPAAIALGEVEMRGVGFGRAATLVAGAMLVLAVAGPAAAHEVSSSRDTVVIAEGAWGSLDPDTFVGDLSLVAVQRVAGDEWILAYERIHTHAVTCDMGTRTTADDEPGFAGTFAFGEGSPDSASIDAKRLGWARASGTVEVTAFVVSSCDDSTDPLGDDMVSVSLDLHAAGRTQRSHDRFRWVEPGEFMLHSMSLTASRPSSGTATVSGHVHQVSSDAGVIARIRSSEHFLTR
jgi:hypothetical protein